MERKGILPETAGLQQRRMTARMRQIRRVVENPRREARRRQKVERRRVKEKARPLLKWRMVKVTVLTSLGIRKMD